VGAGKKTCFGGFCRDFPLLEARQKQKHERREENKLAEHQGGGDLEVVKSRDGEKQESVQQWGHRLGALALGGTGMRRLCAGQLDTCWRGPALTQR